MRAVLANDLSRGMNVDEDEQAEFEEWNAYPLGKQPDEPGYGIEDDARDPQEPEPELEPEPEPMRQRGLLARLLRRS